MIAVILSLFFVLGGIILSKYLRIRAYIIILIILIPYFLCVLGPMHNIFGYPRAITLNSEGKFYDMYYVHNQESYGAKWLGRHGRKNTVAYTDFYGKFRLISQASLPSRLINGTSILNHKRIKGYVYFRYYNVVNNKLMDREVTAHSLTEYDDVFLGKSRIYSNGGAEIYK